MLVIMGYYVITNIASTPMRTVGGLALITAIVIVSVAVLCIVHGPGGGGFGGTGEPRGGDD